jgi:hypothetical protein
MKMRLSQISVFLALVCVAGCSTVNAGREDVTGAIPSGRPGALTPADVKSALANNSFAEAVAGDKTYAVTFNADGSALRTTIGSETFQTGSWRAADPGYCVKWGDAREECYAVNRTAANAYDLVDNSMKVVAHLSNGT